jgi:hypothetical protein
MTPAVKLCFALLTMVALCLPGLAQAEGAPYDENAPAPKPVVKRRKPAARPAPVLPDAPIPYTAIGLSPEMAKALTPDSPAVLEPLPPPVAITPAPLPAQPVEAPPPSVAAHAPAPAIRQISLKCETQVTEGKHLISHGVFYIDLFPSPVFPDEHADFKFLRIDPQHQSLIRESICLDIGCSANVTGSAYYLVNRTTKHGGALRITLDRSSGAFYAEEITSSRIGLDSHRGETGYCTPQKRSNTLF